MVGKSYWRSQFLFQWSNGVRSMFEVFSIGKMSCLHSQVKEAIEDFVTGNRLKVLCMCVLGKYELDTNVVNS